MLISGSKRNLYKLNTVVVNNHIFQASKLKLQKYKRSHENARDNSSPSNASIVPFAVDTLGNFCSVAMILLFYKRNR